MKLSRKKTISFWRTPKGFCFDVNDFELSFVLGFLHCCWFAFFFVISIPIDFLNIITADCLTIAKFTWLIT